MGAGGQGLKSPGVVHVGREPRGEALKTGGEGLGLGALGGREVP